MSQPRKIKQPASRINITLDLETEGASVRRELPLKLLFLGEYDNSQSGMLLRDRPRMRVDGARLSHVLASIAPQLDYHIAWPTGNIDYPIHLEFNSMHDFSPDAICQQVPRLRELMLMRQLLKDLKASVIDKPEFRRLLSQILQEPSTRQHLITELQQGLENVSARGEANGN